MRLSVLGPIAATSDSGTVKLGGRMQKAVLAALLARHPAQVGTGQICDDLWGDDVPPSAHSTLYAYVSRLRKQLGPDVIVKDGDGYRIGLPADAIDVSTFERLIERGADQASETPSEAASTYRSALDLWRGEPYGELGYEPYLVSERARLVELRGAAIEGYMTARLDADATDGALVADLEAALDAYPFRERLWHTLILAMYRQGRQADALRTFRRAARLLRDELGVDPGPELQQLEQQILRQHPDLQDCVRDEDRRAEAANPTNLRRAFTSFVGRDDLVARVVDELAAARVVTLLGPGGTGKTRLAVEVAASSLAARPGGVWDIDLLKELDASVVIPRVADVLAIQPVGDLTARIARHLADRPTMVLLDNCEHLADGIAEQIDRLVDGCPSITVLATSQVAVGAAGERVIRVPPLAHAQPTDSPDQIMAEPASILFEDRVRRVRPGYRAFGADAVAIAQIVDRLDGLPLGIEIAASQAALLPIREIAELIVGGATETLVGASQDPRHGTLEMLVDWSVALLEPAVRDRLAAASVFAGPFTSDAARAIWDPAGEVGPDETARDLEVLMARSLLEEVPPADGSPTRYRALDVVRGHGRRRLERTGLRDEVTHRHRDWVIDLAATAAAHYHDIEQAAWFQRLRLERAEITAALHALRSDRARFRELVGHLWYWYFVDGNLDEVADLLALATEDHPDPVLIGARALVLATQASGPIELVVSEASRARELAGALDPEREEGALALLLAGDALTGIAHMSDAEPLLLEAEHRFRELGIEWGQGWTKLRLVRVEGLGRGRIDAVDTIHADAVAHLEAAGDSLLLAYSDLIFASRERLHGRFQLSLAHGLRSVKAFEQLGARSHGAEATFWVINALVHLDRVDEARRRLPEFRRLCVVSGAWPVDSADLLEAEIARRTGDAELAVEICTDELAEAEHAGDEWGVARWLLELAESRCRAGELDAAEAAVQRAKPFWEQAEDSWRPAQLHVIAAEVAMRAGRWDEARERFDLAIATNERVRQYAWLARSHEGRAELAWLEGGAAAAVADLAHASTIRDSIGTPPDPVRSAELHDLGRRLRRSLGSDEFERAWSAASALALDVGRELPDEPRSLRSS